MSEHTPTPWKADKFGSVKGADGEEIILKGVSLAMSRNPTADSNQEFVVRACNSHDALLAACKAWDEFSDTLINDMDDSDPLRGLTLRLHGKRIAETKAAIALAEPPQ